MIRAFFLSVGQLGDRAILTVLAKSMAVTLAIFALLGAGVWWGTRRLLADGDGGMSAIVALLATVLALWLLFRVVAILVIGLFADEVVEAVEAKHYPTARATARPVAFHRALVMGLRSSVRVVVANLVMLPVYIVLFVTGIGTAIAFFVVNGWLLGRDLGDMVAARHLDGAAMRDWRKASGPRRFALGLANTALFVVPVVNILAPVVGAAMATHMFHKGRA